MKQLEFENAVCAYFSCENAPQIEPPLTPGLRAVGYAAGEVLFKGVTAKRQRPADYRPPTLRLALLRLMPDIPEALPEYHLLVAPAAEGARLTVSHTDATAASNKPNGSMYLETEFGVLDVLDTGRWAVPRLGQMVLETESWQLTSTLSRQSPPVFAQ